MDPGSLARLLGAIAPLSEAERAALDAHVVPLSLPRGRHLLRAGEPSVWLGVVTAGVMREYFTLPSGIERTKSFSAEGAFTGSLPDALAQRPAICSIVAEVDAEILAVPCRAFFAWVGATEGTRSWAAALYARQYVQKADRERELVGMDAGERYAAFRARFPGLEARISQRLVASYLGITPEHLSRMRARRTRSGVPRT